MFVQSVCWCDICYVHVTRMYEQMFWQVEVIGFRILLDMYTKLYSAD